MNAFFNVLLIILFLWLSIGWFLSPYLLGLIGQEGEIAMEKLEDVKEIAVKMAIFSLILPIFLLCLSLFLSKKIKNAEFYDICEVCGRRIKKSYVVCPYCLTVRERVITSLQREHGN